MNYHYGDLANTVIEWILRTGSLERIIAIDLETKVLENNGFLTGETVLCVSLARFHKSVILSRLILLERDDPESEAKLLAELNDCLLQVRPLVLIGYNLCGYDIPLLNLKLRQYPNPICWGIRDTIGRSFHLDMMHPVRFELAKYSNGPKILSLSKVVEHPRFKHLPMMRTKKLVSSADNKGLEIYNMWKNDRRSFKAYAKGDVNDVMMLFHELFLEPILNVPTTKIEACAGWNIEN
jgi:DNA polymerase elongation subunit (family B)